MKVYVAVKCEWRMLCCVDNAVSLLTCCYKRGQRRYLNVRIQLCMKPSRKASVMLTLMLGSIHAGNSSFSQELSSVDCQRQLTVNIVSELSTVERMTTTTSDDDVGRRRRRTTTTTSDDDDVRRRRRRTTTTTTSDDDDVGRRRRRRTTTTSDGDDVGRRRRRRRTTTTTMWWWWWWWWWRWLVKKWWCIV